LAHRVSKALSELGIPTTVHITTGPGDARVRTAKACREEGADHADVFVAVGGDGTLREVVEGLAGAQSPIVFLPAGTANMMARELALPRDPRAAALAVASGRAVTIDAGRWEDHLFLSVAGVGFDAAVARAYAERRKGRGRFLDYAVPLLRTFRRFAPSRLAVDVDGVPRPQCRWALASNARVYGGPLRFAHKAHVQSGFLEAVTLGPASRHSIAAHLFLALAGRFHVSEHTDSTTGSKVTIRPLDHEMPVQLDGDFTGVCTPDKPAVFEIIPKACILLLGTGGRGR